MPTTLKSRIPEIVAELPVAVEEALLSGSESIARDAEARAPFDASTPEHLRTGITAELRGPMSVGIMALWRYHFTEYGTHSQSAQPFLHPAVVAGVPELVAKVRAAVTVL